MWYQKIMAKARNVALEAYFTEYCTASGLGDIGGVPIVAVLQVASSSSHVSECAQCKKPVNETTTVFHRLWCTLHPSYKPISKRLEKKLMKRDGVGSEKRARE